MGVHGPLSPMRKAVFLDRDGVINRSIVRAGKPYPPSGLHELEVLPGVAEACRTLSSAGWLLIAVTNQPDVARGTQDRKVVEAINDELTRAVRLDQIRVCWHDDAEDCACRKPKPGLLTQAAQEWGVDLSRSVMVGDRWRDVDAGANAGCRTIFIDYGYDEKLRAKPDHVVGSLLEAVPWILELDSRRSAP